MPVCEAIPPVNDVAELTSWCIISVFSFYIALYRTARRRLITQLSVFRVMFRIQVAVVQYTSDSYTVSIPLTQYTDESSLKVAIASLSYTTGSSSGTHFGLEGMAKVFNESTLRIGSRRSGVIIFDTEWTHPELVCVCICLIIRIVISFL